MKRNTIVLAVTALVVIAAIGYSQGRHASPRMGPPIAGGAETAGHGTRAKASPSVERPAPAMLPADLDELDGNRFIAAMPELERRARAGDAKATRLLISRLQECASYTAEGDAEITRRVDEAYQRQLEIQEKYPLAADQAQYAVTEETRRSELKRGFDRRDRCTALTARQIGSRLELADLALRRHDRQTILDFTAIGELNVSGAERVRYVDRLGELATLERAELDRLVGAGDLKAMTSGAYGYSRERTDLVSGDPLRAYAYAYVWTLADSSGDKRGMEQMMAGLASNRLSPQQVDEARALGQALYQRCCNNGNGGHLSNGP